MKPIRDEIAREKLKEGHKKKKIVIYGAPCHKSTGNGKLIKHMAESFLSEGHNVFTIGIEYNGPQKWEGKIPILPGFHCIHPKQEIITVNGIKYAEEITTDDILINALGNRVQVEHVQKRTPKEDLLKIYTSVNKNPLIISENHGMYYLKDTFCPIRKTKIICESSCYNYNKKWSCNKAKFNDYEISKKTPAKKLTINDSLFYPVPHIQRDLDYIDLGVFHQNRSKSQKINNIPLTKDFLWMFGMYIAEGSTTSGNKKYSHDPKTLQFSLHINEEKYANKIKKCFNFLGCKVNSINRKKVNTKVILISNIDLCDSFTILFGKGCENKRIPRILLDLHKDKLKYIWQGVMDGDGYKKENSLHQTSKQLVCDMFEISLKLQKFPSIHSKIKQKNRKDSYIIGFGKNNKHFQRSYNKGLYINPIKKIERIPNNKKEPLIDITVKGSHDSILTPQGIIGNCEICGNAHKGSDESVQKIADWINVLRPIDYFICVGDPYQMQQFGIGNLGFSEKTKVLMYCTYDSVGNFCNEDLTKGGLKDYLLICDRIIANSKWSQIQLKEWENRSSDVIYVTSDMTTTYVPVTKEKKIELKKKNRFKENDFVIFSSGRNIMRKRHNTLIDGAAKLICETDNVYLYLNIPPDDGWREDGTPVFANNQNPWDFVKRVLKKKYGRDLAAENRIIFIKNEGLGSVKIDEKQNAELYQLADVYAYATAGESFGVCPVESMSCGVPVIIPDNSTGREILGIDNEEKMPESGFIFGKGGLLVNCPIESWADYGTKQWLTTSETIYNALKFLYKDPKLRENLGKQGMEYVTKTFNLDDFRKKWLEIIRTTEKKKPKEEFKKVEVGEWNYVQ